MLLLCNTPLCHAASDSECKAIIMYKEAASESVLGKRAVLNVVHNRMLKFNKTSCEVMKQPGQFSFWHNKAVFVSLNTLTEAITLDSMEPVLPDRCLYFYDKRLHPTWAKNLRKIVIGKHTFGCLKEN